MTKLHRIFLPYLTGLLLAISSGHAFAQNSHFSSNDLPISINILAPTSMTNVMSKIIREFSVKENISIASHFASANQLIDIIKRGDSADIIIADFPLRKDLSEPATPMDDIHNLGLIDIQSRTNIISDQLALVSHKDNVFIEHINLTQQNSLYDILGLLNEDHTLITPSTITEAAGLYAKEGLITLGFWKSLEARITPYSDNRQALHHINQTRGLGMVYMSDIHNFDHIIPLATFPQNSHAPITYQAAAVVGKQMSLARRFIHFLNSKPAQKIFRDYGFKTLSTQPKS